MFTFYNVHILVILQHSPCKVRLAGTLVSTMFEVMSIVLPFTSVPLLMVELDGMKRRDETVSAMGASVTFVISLFAWFEPYPVPLITHPMSAPF